MIDYHHTDSGQSNPLDFSAHLIKSVKEKKEKYSAAVSRSGHQFMPFVLDKFGNVLEDTKEMMMYRMFLSKAFNDKHDITESEAKLIATMKLRF